MENKKILVLRGNWGYAYPERVIFALVIGGEWQQQAAAAYVKSAANTLEEGYTHFEKSGAIYPITKDGCNKAIADIFGTSTSIMVEAADHQWKAQFCRVLGSTDVGLTLRPTAIIDGRLYAATEYKERGQYVGDNVCMTGGSKPYGKEQNGVKVPFYCETFNAGGGRVTAGIDGDFFLDGKVCVHEAKGE